MGQTHALAGTTFAMDALKRSMNCRITKRLTVPIYFHPGLIED